MRAAAAVGARGPRRAASSRARAWAAGSTFLAGATVARFVGARGRPRVRRRSRRGRCRTRSAPPSRRVTRRGTAAARRRARPPGGPRGSCLPVPARLVELLLGRAHPLCLPRAVSGPTSRTSTSQSATRSSSPRCGLAGAAPTVSAITARRPMLSTPRARPRARPRSRSGSELMNTVGHARTSYERRMRALGARYVRRRGRPREHGRGSRGVDARPARRRLSRS